MKIRTTKCATCPWREDSPYSYLKASLMASALTQASRICHSTGTNAISTTSKAEQLCRGARDEQLQMFHAMGFLSKPTDKAWRDKCREMGIAPDGVKRTEND